MIFGRTIKLIRELRNMDDFYLKAGLRIRELREMNRYTREQFSEMTDISPKFLYEIETGQKGFSADTLYRISRGLCVTSEYILTGESGSLSEELRGTLGLFNDGQMETLSQVLKLLYELTTKAEPRSPVRSQKY